MKFWEKLEEMFKKMLETCWKWKREFYEGVGIVTCLKVLKIKNVEW